MIEIIYDETEQGKETPEVPVKLPKNLRQIGEGNTDVRIYIEDYVMTFIRKLWEKGEATVGILLGEVKRSGRETYIFVPGAISIDEMPVENGHISFTDESWAKIYGTIKQYFNKYMIVGWFFNRAETCQEAEPWLKKLHLDNFPGNDKILFLSDFQEKEEKVYRFEGGDLLLQSVYYIYYERNEDMQEYMLTGKQGEPEALPETQVKDTVPGNYRAILQEKKDNNSQRRMVGFLYGACTFLAVVILMIGVAMMNNYDKIESLEQLVSDLYRTAMGQVQQENRVEEETPGPVIDKISGNVLPEKKTEQTTSDTESQAESKVMQESEKSSATESVGVKESESPTENVIRQSENDETTVPESTADSVEETTDTLAEEKYHMVIAGDTLTSISRQFYNTDKMVEAIMELNHIENGDYIYPGQIIMLP